MGKSGSGKTSMRSIIFADYLARDTHRLQATIDVEYSSVQVWCFSWLDVLIVEDWPKLCCVIQFLGNLHLHLWDCGGQEGFYVNYLTTMRDRIFSSVELLVYVFDIADEMDMGRFNDVMEALDEHSRDAKVFVLLHKMDLVPEEVRDQVFKDREDAIQTACRSYRGLTVRCFPSSIWDESLYRAWSQASHWVKIEQRRHPLTRSVMFSPIFRVLQVVYCLVPNTKILEDNLGEFCRICGADEVVLFESTTFLVIAHCEDKREGRVAHADGHRFEKISNIIKQFKLSCRKAQAQFDGMMVQNSLFTSFFNLFTSNTCIMVIVSDPKVQPEAIQLNVEAARGHFDSLIPQTTGST
jgi:Ras-related GTP-binding protein A/B